MPELLFRQKICFPLPGKISNTNFKGLLFQFYLKVALGNSKDLSDLPTQRPEASFNSIKISGREAFAEEKEVSFKKLIFF